MKRCNSCGGIIGVDCFNQAECAAITRDMAEMREQEAMEERENSGPDDCQITTGGLVKPTPARPRFEVTWDGYAESCFKVADNQTRAIIKEFDCAILGTNTARTAAGKLATTLNGELRQCPECGGAGREQMGPSEQPCIHCNGGGFQVFKR